MKKKPLGLQEKRRAMMGWIFISPWLAGTIFFFLQALVQVVRYSFTEVRFDTELGMVIDPLENLFENYIFAFNGDDEYSKLLVESLTSMLYQIPVILILSLFVAILLNQNFRGRGFMRSVFFIPILITSGLIASIINNNQLLVVLGGGTETTSFFDATILTNSLISFGLPQTLVDVLGTAVENVTDLIWNSGVQILVFLMGILAIPESYYDVAKAEGAGGWETFCKVVFPSVTPYIALNFVYTMIDIFVNYDNQVMQWIIALQSNVKISYASAMALIYFLIIIGAIGIVLGIILLISKSRERKERALL